MFQFNRRSGLMAATLGAAALLLGACGSSGDGASAEGDMSLGEADAPVTVIEYASVTCSHCAAWHTSTFPEFKRRYIDTGQVRYIFREFPTPPASIAAAGFLTARCAGEDRYFTLLSAMMNDQRAFVTNPRPFLLNLARSAGMNEQEFDACVTNEEALAAFSDRRDAAIAAGITGTPYFLLNGEPMTGSISIEAFEEAIRPIVGGEPPAEAAAIDAIGSEATSADDAAEESQAAEPTELSAEAAH